MNYSRRNKPQVFERYKENVIVLDKNTFKYGDEILLVYNTDSKLKSIFENGIFYPELITGKLKIGNERKQDLDAMLIRNDSLRITDFEEQKSLSNSPKIKRFKFWVFSKGFANPTVYFIELTNSKARKKTDMTKFLKRCRITFLKKGWLIM